MLLALIELIVATIVGVSVFTQIVAPMWRGTKLFPFFRRQGALESALDQTRQERKEADLEEQLREAQQELERRSPKPKPGAGTSPDATTKE
jgi:hypothetical protein